MDRPDAVRGLVAIELSRRDFLQRVSVLGVGALVASALPFVDPAAAAVPLDDATFQAFCDTIIPGRKVAKTDLGDEVDPRAIAGVDSEPGAVEADALRLGKSPITGYDTLRPTFLADLNTRSPQQGAPFLFLSFDKRVAVVKQGLDFSNPARQATYEASAAIAFAAFCGAGIHPGATNKNFSGYKVMGYPGLAPNGYRSFSYRRKLNRGRTKKGYLP